VRELLAGSRGFSELQRGIGKVSPRLLTARLRLLEDEGVLSRTVHPTKPPSTEYALTPHGHALHALIAAMAAFGTLCQRRDAEQPPPSAAPRDNVKVHRLR
jgi:DNA-binding HxlR family transcriptional regulator